MDVFCVPDTEDRPRVLDVRDGPGGGVSVIVAEAAMSAEMIPASVRFLPPRRSQVVESSSPVRRGGEWLRLLPGAPRGHFPQVPQKNMKLS